MEIIISNNQCTEEYSGLDGKYFKIALNQQLEFRDVITLYDNVNIGSLFITNEPVIHISSNDFEGECWIHTVRLITNNCNHFFPGKYLTKGTRFIKLIA